MEFKNLNIIGTSHVSKESILEIQSEIANNYDLVAIELDRNRLYALLHPEVESKSFSFSSIFKIGLKGFIFGMLAKHVQETVGKKLGIKPGSDMLEAYKQAKKNKIPIMLIDSDIQTVLSKISKEITFKERFKFIGDLLYSLIFPMRYAKKYNLEKLDLSKVPSGAVINSMMKKMSGDYPTIYRILVLERNVLMARRLYALMHTHEKVLAVVGAGHEEDIIKLVKRYFEMHIDVI